MKRIYVIGGGEISKGETYLLDKLMIQSLNIAKPKVLFIPTASHDAKGYIESVTYEFEKLNCFVDSLCLCAGEKNPYFIRNKISWADIIYVGGGDTSYMMQEWRRSRTDEFLKNAYENGKVLSGLSAGGICWFNRGYSDSLIIEEKGKFSLINGLGLINMDHNPHANEEDRKNFLAYYKTIEGTALSLDNLIMAEFIDGKLKDCYSLKTEARATMISSIGGVIKTTPLETKIVN